MQARAGSARGISRLVWFEPLSLWQTLHINSVESKLKDLIDLSFLLSYSCRFVLQMPEVSQLFINKNLYRS